MVQKAVDYENTQQQNEQMKISTRDFLFSPLLCFSCAYEYSVSFWRDYSYGELWFNTNHDVKSTLQPSFSVGRLCPRWPIESTTPYQRIVLYNSDSSMILLLSILSILRAPPTRVPRALIGSPPIWLRPQVSA